MVIVAFVEKKLVEVELVEVVFVKTPVDGVTLPIGVALMEPPVTVTFVEVKLLILPVTALIVVPEAVVKPSHAEDVPFVKYRFVEVTVPVKRPSPMTSSVDDGLAVFRPSWPDALMTSRTALLPFHHCVRSAVWPVAP